jgi:transposase
MKQFDAVRMIFTTDFNDRAIGASLGLSKTTVGRYRGLIAAKGLAWEDVRELDPAQVHRLFNRPTHSGPLKQMPDFEFILKERRKKGATLQVLWHEYRRMHPHSTLSYSHYTAKVRAYKETLPSVMRLTHTPGQQVFVDYSGDLPHYFDRGSGARVPTQLFVGVLPASSMTFAMATHTQQSEDFLRAHVEMFHYFGGTPKVVVCDNLKSGIVKAGKAFVPHRSYEQLTAYYGATIIPARAFHPKDKAAVERAVKHLQETILFPMRNDRFSSLDELNAAIRERLDDANSAPMTKKEGSRRERLDSIERGALVPLPPTPYEHVEWITHLTVPSDYHVNVKKHHYSVPHALVSQQVEARVRFDTVEIYHHRKLVASHPRSATVGGHTTDPVHQTDDHRAYGERSPEGLQAWAARSGPHLDRLMKHLFGGPLPFKALPQGDALRSLANQHGTKVVDDLARRAFELNAPTVSTVKRLLSTAASAAKAGAGPGQAGPRSTLARSARFYLEGASCSKNS